MRNNLNTVLLLVAILSLAQPLTAQKYAPLNKVIIEAKTIYMEHFVKPSILDVAFRELDSWGQFDVVNSLEKADLVLSFKMAKTDLLMAIFDRRKNPLDGGLVWTVSCPVGKSHKCIEELRKRFPKEPKRKP